MTENKKYKLAIIGSGPAGYAAVLAAAKYKQNTLLIEGNHFGGVCLNTGCIPTKFLIKSADLLSDIYDAENYGLRIKSDANDIKRITSRARGVIDNIKQRMYNSLKYLKCDYVKGFAYIKDNKNIIVDGNEYYTENILIASGSENYIPVEIPFEQKNIYTSDTILEIQEIPERLVIIGAGNIGLEYAYIFNSFGSKVYILEKLNRVLSTAENEISIELEKILKKKGINVYKNIEKINIAANGNVSLNISKKNKYIKNPKILIACGRTPRINNMGLEDLGIIKNRNIAVDSRYRTVVKNVYAAGDVLGRHMTAHAAAAEARIVIDAINEKAIEDNLNLVPNVLYGSPEVAWCGLSENQCKELGKNYKSLRGYFKINSKACVLQKENGFIKLLIENNTQQILGVHMIGPLVSEILGEITLLMRNKISFKKLSHNIRPHPTFSEIITDLCNKYSNVN